MIAAIEEDSVLRAQIVQTPEHAIRDNFKIIPNNPVYRYVVFFLGLTITLIVIGYFVITILGKGPLDSAIIAIASSAVGALAGLLAPQPD